MARLQLLDNRHESIGKPLCSDLVKWLSSCSRLFLYRLHENWTLVEFRYLGPYKKYCAQNGHKFRFQQRSALLQINLGI